MATLKRRLPCLTLRLPIYNTVSPLVRISSPSKNITSQRGNNIATTTVTMCHTEDARYRCGHRTKNPNPCEPDPANQCEKPWREIPYFYMNRRCEQCSILEREGDDDTPPITLEDGDTSSGNTPPVGREDDDMGLRNPPPMGMPRATGTYGPPTAMPPATGTHYSPTPSTPATETFNPPTTMPPATRPDHRPGTIPPTMETNRPGMGIPPSVGGFSQSVPFLPATRLYDVLPVPINADHPGNLRRPSASQKNSQLPGTPPEMED